jgi:hypothetical protein
MGKNQVTNSFTFPQLVEQELAHVSGGAALTDADATRIRELAEDFCPNTAKANAGVDYKSLTRETAQGLTNACLGEIRTRDGNAAHDTAKKKIDEAFRKHF